MKPRALGCVLVAVVMLSSAPTWSKELVFTTQDFSPFSYEIDGVVSGPAAEIIRAVCEEIRTTCRFRLLPWTRAQQEVKTGKAHGMFVIGWNRARAAWVHFTPPIITTEYGIFVKNTNSMSFSEFEDIANYKIGVYGPSNTSKSLEKIRADMTEKGIEPISIDMRPDDESGFKKLALGRLDAVFSNRDVGYAMISKLGLKGQIRYAGPQRKLKYFIGFSQEYNDEDQLKAFDSAYRTLYRQGTIKTILDKYSMEVADPD